MRDLADQINVKRAISPAAAGTDNTAIVSQIIDRGGYESLVFVIDNGVNTDTDATFAVTMDHGDTSNLADAAAVPTANLTGTLANAGWTAANDDNTERKIGYVGSKRYVRLTVTPTGNNSGNIYVSASAILSGSRFAPTPAVPA